MLSSKFELRDISATHGTKIMVKSGRVRLHVVGTANTNTQDFP